ncbi:MAG: endonuclease/exonuclease/phosphatase family protein [Nitrospirae bacterium]|nr:endonuclease/exonuclease/phosphatase family protein [Nitrospirota bacterium]MBF0540643.1 endonuclease/exonuclease/phosphatase family protein [Nitrospirota bacterium]
MDTTQIISSLINLFRTLLPNVLSKKDSQRKDLQINPVAFNVTEELWGILMSKAKTNIPLKDALNEMAVLPDDDDVAASLRLQFKKLLAKDESLQDIIGDKLNEVINSGFQLNYSIGLSSFKWLEVLDKNDATLKRLEMIRQFRCGVPLHQITEAFHTDTEYVHRVNAAFSHSGTQGVISGSNVRHWLDTLDPNDNILRRLDMIGQLKSGTPPEIIARQYNTLPDYVHRIASAFDKYGAVGILTEEDFRKYRTIYPDTIRICSFNLHGTHDSNDYYRFKRIAHELSAYEPEICSFQEVISGYGIEETSAQIATWLTNITGYHYRTFFGHCHLFMDKYPEGIAVSAKYQLKNTNLIDLNKGLRGEVHPLMERFAAVSEVEIRGKKIVFASVHLDHSEDERVRPAQVEKLHHEINRIYGKNDIYCTILAGDFNDIEDSKTINYLVEKGYKDAYRACSPSGGNTYPSHNPYTRIDYIMVKGDVKFLQTSLILKDPSLSDHVGILAVIE